MLETKTCDKIAGKAKPHKRNSQNLYNDFRHTSEKRA